MKINADSIVETRGDEPDPFGIDARMAVPVFGRAAFPGADRLLSWVLALDTYRALYHRAQTGPGEGFCARALNALEISIDVERGAARWVPHSGALIVVANHPHGMLDGLVVADVVQRRRGDVRILTNHLLTRIPELTSLCLFVDPFGGRDAAARSCAGLRSALRWLVDGHALIVFPAGTVASRRPSVLATPSDSDWHDTVGRLAVRSGAAVVPAFIEGCNSRWFYRAGRLHSSFRTLLLARELLGHRGRLVTVHVGRPIYLTDHVTAAADPKAATALLRNAVEALAPAPTAQPRRSSASTAVERQMRAVEEEVNAFGPEQRLVSSGQFDVFCVPALSIPTALQEIGRLREMSFRAVGEGSGRAVDLDRFDGHYLHLFAWHRDRREIVGAYRIGPTDQILVSQGTDGLYTSTLFRYDPRLLTRLAPALELGRSFVRAEYQRSSNALLALWKGIARFVVRSRRYRVLFGPVSISSRYSDMSQRLLRAFLAQNVYHRELGELVEAITPPRDVPSPVAIDPMLMTDVHDLDTLIARLETDGKGIPVLLRQYLRLNARLLGFNIDPAFGDVLDALMMVDLADVDRPILNRYFGKAEAQELLTWVSRASSGRAA